MALVSTFQASGMREDCSAFLRWAMARYAMLRMLNMDCCPGMGDYWGPYTPTKRSTSGKQSSSPQSDFTYITSLQTLQKKITIHTEKQSLERKCCYAAYAKQTHTPF
jgi:hypothetical protein